MIHYMREDDSMMTLCGVRFMDLPIHEDVVRLTTKLDEWDLCVWCKAEGQHEFAK